MVDQKLLSVIDIARELNTGKATVKYVLKRFGNQLPPEFVNGQALYSPESLKSIIFILEEIESGTLPSIIEKQLSENKPESITEDLNILENFSSISPEDDIKLSQNGLNVLNKVFKEINDQQKRIAKAHEERAEAEQRKAVAIEKRAAAEEKKAVAMNNIASALQEMNKLRSGDIGTQNIAHQAATIIASDEAEPVDIPETYDEEEKQDHDSRHTSVSNVSPDQTDDLSALIDEVPDNTIEENTIEDMDDLSSLLGDSTQDESSVEPSISQDNETAVPDTIETDNLYSLLEDAGTSEIEQTDSGADDDMDDLSLLIDQDIDRDINQAASDSSQTKEPEENIQPEDIDDLSKLIDQGTQSNNKQTEDMPDTMDDLSALIDTPSSSSLSDDMELDDLSSLISSPSKDSDSKEPDLPDPELSEMDDLSQLISDKADTQDTQATSDKDQSSQPSVPMDDLSQLISPDSEKPKTSEPVQKEESTDSAKDKITIGFSPKDDVKKYKAAVMQLILGFKKDGMSVEQTTEKLNANKIETLSGKPEWGQKAISQIYKFIESAK